MKPTSEWQDKPIACPIVRNSLLQQQRLLDESVSALQLSRALLKEAFQQLNSMVFTTSSPS